MIDIFLIVLFLWAAFSGWRAGFVKEVISTVGILVGLFIAATCYQQFGEYLAVNGSETNMVTSIIAFILLWIVVPIALGFVANVLTAALKGMQLGMPNSILGTLVSVVKFLVLISCVFNVMQALHIMNPERMAESRLYTPITKVVGMWFDNPAGEAAVSDGFDAEKSDTVWIERTDTTAATSNSQKQ